MEDILQSLSPFSSPLTQAAIEASLGAGALLARGFESDPAISHIKEGIYNIVTEYDVKSEDFLIRFLSSALPGSQFLSEESGQVGASTSPFLWIIDPLDGTVNFAHHIPFFCISIALQEKGVTVLGVIYHPLTEELFVAEKGQGAFLSQKGKGWMPIRVSSSKGPGEGVFAIGFPYDILSSPAASIDPLIRLLERGIPLRRLGAGALDLAYVASGRFDLFYETSLSPWDVAAGKLLVEEAQGQVTHLDGTPFDILSRQPLIATNPRLYPQAVSIIQGTR